MSTVLLYVVLVAPLAVLAAAEIWFLLIDPFVRWRRYRRARFEAQGRQRIGIAEGPRR